MNWRTRLTIAAMFFASLASAALAGPGISDSSGNRYDAFGIMAPGGAAIGSKANPVPTYSPIAAPVAITPSDATPFTPGTQGVEFVVTVAGNIAVTFPNGVSWVVPVTTGVYFFPWQINKVLVTGSTATFTAFALN